MANVKLFTFKERQLLEKLASTDLSAKEIGIKIGRAKTSILGEYRKRGGRENYTAENAQEDCVEKQKQRRQRKWEMMTQEKETIIMQMIDDGESLYRICANVRLRSGIIREFLESKGINCNDLTLSGVLFKIKFIQEQISILFEQIRMLNDRYSENHKL